MEHLKSTWKLEPGDGTGSSIADAEVRNARGECAIQGCGKPINRDLKRWMVGYLCDECNAWMEAYVEQIVREAVDDLDRSFVRLHGGEA